MATHVTRQEGFQIVEALVGSHDLLHQQQLLHLLRADPAALLHQALGADEADLLGEQGVEAERFQRVGVEVEARAVVGHQHAAGEGELEIAAADLGPHEGDRHHRRLENEAGQLGGQALEAIAVRRLGVAEMGEVEDQIHGIAELAQPDGPHQRRQAPRLSFPEPRARLGDDQGLAGGQPGKLKAGRAVEQIAALVHDHQARRCFTVATPERRVTEAHLNASPDR